MNAKHPFIIASVFDLHTLHSVPYPARIALDVSRRFAHQGLMGGVQVALQLALLPKRLKGMVSVTFGGWEEDPREVHEIPLLMEFMAGLILFDPSTVIPWLIDERHLMSFEKDGRGISGLFDHHGQMFWIAALFRNLVSSQEGQIYVGLLDYLRSLLMGSKEPPFWPTERVPEDFVEVAAPGVRGAQKLVWKTVEEATGRKPPKPGGLISWARPEDLILSVQSFKADQRLNT